MDMGMTAADENEVLGDRNALLHRLTMPEGCPEDEGSLPGSRSGSLVAGKYCDDADSSPSHERLSIPK
jgi:hypothetical protein